MSDKVTKNTVRYPKGYEQDFIIVSDDNECRFVLGKKGDNPLVAICMNPSAASEEVSDKTINRIISISRKLDKSGWTVLNVYPERATSASDLNPYKEEVSSRNIEEIKKYLTDNNINEVWGAWGDNDNIEAIKKGKEDLMDMLKQINVKIFYFGTLTKSSNPRHPLQRQEKWDVSIKNYYEL